MITVERDTKGIPCSECDGYAKQILATEEEEAKFGCGRKGCCLCVFWCLVCNHRSLTFIEAPEME